MLLELVDHLLLLEHLLQTGEEVRVSRRSVGGGGGSHGSDDRVLQCRVHLQVAVSSAELWLLRVQVLQGLLVQGSVGLAGLRVGGHVPGSSVIVNWALGPVVTGSHLIGGQVLEASRAREIQTKQIRIGAAHRRGAGFSTVQSEGKSARDPRHA